MIDKDAIRLRWDAVGAKLDERGRRLSAAAEVQAAGHGGLKVVAEITGIARSTINRGEDDLNAADPSAGQQAASPLPKGKIRRPGGGRKALAAKNPELIPALERLVEPATRHGGAMLRMDAIRCGRCSGSQRAWANSPTH